MKNICQKGQTDIWLIKSRFVKIEGMQKQSRFLTELIGVGIGGAIGGSVRYLLGLVPIIGAMPVMTMLINWVGTFLLASLGAYLAKRESRLQPWQTFIGTG